MNAIRISRGQQPGQLSIPSESKTQDDSDEPPDAHLPSATNDPERRCELSKSIALPLSRIPNNSAKRRSASQNPYSVNSATNATRIWTGTETLGTITKASFDKTDEVLAIFATLAFVRFLVVEEICLLKLRTKYKSLAFLIKRQSTLARSHEDVTIHLTTFAPDGSTRLTGLFIVYM